MKTYYIVENALTKGILRVQGEVGSDGWLEAKINFGSGVGLFPPRGFAETFDEARQKACRMRQMKIASLYEQIIKLEGLTFEESVDGC